eukprot:TRINITY_DN16162_c0_g1_i1.p1 TRINITY_DN16162_c0_g1~~TRINITY_DN16162_c0_g1_i1.p1  ORF type:complete len:585 (-),score=185.01 TRINITY_DN16162_c0_g1_i1:184-1938(-)
MNKRLSFWNFNSVNRKKGNVHAIAREENAKKLQETMLAAFNDSKNSNSIPKELEFASAAHKKEVQTLKEQYKIAIENLERQVADYKRQNEDLEEKISLITLDKEALLTNNKDKFKELEAKLKDANKKVKALTESKKVLQEAMELDTQVKMANLNTSVEKMKAEHLKEMEDVKRKSEASLEDIKYLYHQEKIALERRIEKMQAEMKMLEAQKEADSTQRQLCDLQANYISEIQELNSHLDSFKKQSHDEITALMREKDEKERNIESLEREVSNANEAYIEIETMYKRIAAEAKETARKLEECQSQIIQMQTYIQQLETNEYELKVLLENKESELEIEKESMRQKCSEEKWQAHESCSKQKIECERRLTQTLHDSVLKDKRIKDLSRQLEAAARKSESTEAILEKGAKVECKKCKELVAVREFGEHVAKGCEEIGIEVAISQLKSEKYKFFPSATESPLTFEKKVKDMEELLKEVKFKYNLMRQQRDKVQMELDKASAELIKLRRLAKRDSKLPFASIRTSNPPLEQENSYCSASNANCLRISNKENEDKNGNRGYPLRSSKASVSSHKGSFFSANDERASVSHVV